VLAKDTHGATLRMSPPLVATVEEIALAVDALTGVLADLGQVRSGRGGPAGRPRPAAPDATRRT
jgi:hypothetical protein